MDDAMSTNARAARGNTALSAWVNECGDQGDEETNLTDMLTDLMHLSDAQGFNWSKIAERARVNHNEEIHELGVATAVGSEPS